MAFLHGRGVPECPESAARYFARALPSPSAACHLQWIIVSDAQRRSGSRKEAVEELRELAERGYPEADYYLGRLWVVAGGEFTGDGLRHHVRAAAAGYRPAQRALARAWLGGITDSDEGLAWLRKLAAEGEAAAQCSLGLVYDGEFAVGRDDVEAAKWLQAAAENGNAQAALALGRLLSRSKADARAEQDAVRWWRLASEAGETYAMYELGRALYEGRGSPRATKEALAWLRRAAFTKRCSEAGEYLGHIYIRARRKDPDSQLRLGECYDTLWGDPLLMTDLETALKWYWAAAKSGLPEAQYKLGRLYLFHCRPLGYEMHDAGRHAVTWFERAAEAGHTPAQCALDSPTPIGGSRTGSLWRGIRERAQSGSGVRQSLVTLRPSGRWGGASRLATESRRTSPRRSFGFGGRPRGALASVDPRGTTF